MSSIASNFVPKAVSIQPQNFLPSDGLTSPVSSGTMITQYADRE